ncbi:MAG TPA: hypothetical protein VN455_00240 [Methanotrichaceae archaeon]|nr:hypothetical protein [Methanotrichaceae archaeon]
MLKQIEKAADKFDAMAGTKRNEFRSILQRYVDGQIGLDEAYYLLMDGDLIPMPSRCGMFPKSEITAEDEARLKSHITEKVLKASS